MRITGISKELYEKYNNCDYLLNEFDFLSVPQSALLWCGIPRNEINEYLKECKPKGDSNGLLRNTFVHPYIQCVEPRCKLLHIAFDEGRLKMGRDGEKGGYIYGEKDLSEPKNGYYSGGMGHIAHDRRTIKIADLKEFIAEYHPSDMPKSLFNDIEIHKVQPISNDDYLALVAKLDSLQAKNEDLENRLTKARNIFKEQQSEIDYYKSLNNNVNFIDERTENSYLTTIALLLEIMQTPKGINDKPPFDSQSQIIGLIESKDIQGQRKSTLETRFSNANKALEQAKKAK